MILQGGRIFSHVRFGSITGTLNEKQSILIFLVCLRNLLLVTDGNTPGSAERNACDHHRNARTQFGYIFTRERT